MRENNKKSILFLHVAVMLFGFSGVLAQYVQVPAVLVAMGRVICSSLLLLAISLVKKDKLTLESKKDYALIIGTGVIMAIHWSSFFQAIQVSSVAIGTITFSTFPLFLTFMEPVVFKEKLRARRVISAVILLAGVYITVPEFSVENQVTVGILWGMLCSFTYAIMTLGNRYFSKKYTGRIICLYEQGTAAIVLLPALWLVKVEWRPVDIAGVAAIGFVCTADCIFIICICTEGCARADGGNYIRNGNGLWNHLCICFSAGSSDCEHNCWRSSDPCVAVFFFEIR